MTFDDYLLHLFYLVDSELETLHLGRLRERGPMPTLHDSEVLTMELAGEFLGIDTDTGIYRFFRSHHLKVSRSGPCLSHQLRASGSQSLEGSATAARTARGQAAALRSAAE